MEVNRLIGQVELEDALGPGLGGQRVVVTPQIALKPGPRLRQVPGSDASGPSCSPVVMGPCWNRGGPLAFRILDRFAGPVCEHPGSTKRSPILGSSLRNAVHHCLAKSLYDTMFYDKCLTSGSTIECAISRKEAARES
jgi:hypothetical protein